MYEQPDSATRKLNQLKVVAVINVGDKVCTETPMFHIQPAGVRQTLWRSLTGESRNRNIRAISDLVVGTIDHVEHALLRRNQDQRTVQMTTQLARALLGARMGIQNLAHSYTHDKTTVVQLHTLVDSIGMFEARHYHPPEDMCIE